MSAQAAQIPAGPTDIELMLGVRSGEAHLLELLLLRHRHSILHFLYRMVRNEAVAEELAQDVFLNVYRARERYQPSAHFTAWLYRIARNRAMNWVRDNRHQSRTVPLDRPAVRRSVLSATPEQELLRREARQRVREAIDALPERQRRAVLLHKYGDLDYVEIAQVLQCSISAVKSLLNRAYQTLRASPALCPHRRRLRE